MEKQWVDKDFYDAMEKKFEQLSDEERYIRMGNAFEKKRIFKREDKGKKEEKIASYLGIRHKTLREKYFSLFKQVWREKRMIYLLDRPMATARALKRLEKMIENMINKFVCDEDVRDDLEFMCGHDRQMMAEVEKQLEDLHAKWLFHGGDNEDIAFEDMIALGKIEQEAVDFIKKLVRNSIYEYNNLTQHY